MHIWEQPPIIRLNQRVPKLLSFSFLLARLTLQHQNLANIYILFACLFSSSMSSIIADFAKTYAHTDLTKDTVLYFPILACSLYSTLDSSGSPGQCQTLGYSTSLR